MEKKRDGIVCIKNCKNSVCPSRVGVRPENPPCSEREPWRARRPCVPALPGSLRTNVCGSAHVWGRSQKEVGVWLVELDDSANRCCVSQWAQNWRWPPESWELGECAHRLRRLRPLPHQSRPQLWSFAHRSECRSWRRSWLWRCASNGCCRCWWRWACRSPRTRRPPGTPSPTKTSLEEDRPLWKIWIWIWFKLLHAAISG